MKPISSYQAVFLGLIWITVSAAAGNVLGETAKHTLSPRIVAAHTSYFDLRDGEISGTDGWVEEAERVRFVALGEIHDSRRMSEFTTWLLRRLADGDGPRALAAEIGPHSATVLAERIARGPEAVTALYDQYSSKLFDIYPIPFFKGRLDLRILAEAHHFGYELWGLDQEFYFSFPFLLDELEDARNAPVSEDNRRLHRKIDRKLYRWFRRASVFSSFPMTCRVQEDPKIGEYLDTFKPTVVEVGRILGALERSLEIYCLAESGQGRVSNRLRIEDFRKNFDRHYVDLTAVSDSPPRVVLKMGSYHAGRHESPLGALDVGHHLHRLGEESSAGSLHLRFLNRYFEGGEDAMAREGWAASRNLMSVGRRDHWALVDLRALRELHRQGELHLSEFEAREVRNYDYLVVMPEDSKVRRHY